MWNYECSYCGAPLDPGENCYCQDKEEERRRQYMGNFKESRNGQMVFNFGGNNENNKDSDSRHTGYQGI